MNKEKIEEIKKLLFQDRLTQYEKRKLVQYLEQKEAILDKVTDIVKTIIRRIKTELMYGTMDMLEDLQNILNVTEGDDIK